MEAIRNYLESMFAALPNTPEVLKAKDVLLQMMEDKYQELREEGKTENEAIGTVISEFGNLDELAEDLGLTPYVKDEAPVMKKIFPMEEVKNYIAMRSKNAVLVALGVFLCITSPIPCILMDTYMDTVAGEAIGASLLFVIIGIAVGLFVATGILSSKYDYLKKEPYAIDFATTEFVRNQANMYRSTHALILTVGIVLCVVSVIPAIIIDGLSPKLEDLAGAAFMATVALGVFMIVLTGIKSETYTKLLKLNDVATVGGNYVPEQKNGVTYDDPTVATIMSVFWPTVTCIYLAWSFLSFDWHITWIIWPIAAIVNAVVKYMLGHK